MKHWLLFFLDDFHHGVVNHLVHAVGFTLLGYGLGKPSWIAIIISPFVMEIGHFYNYARGIHQEQAVKIIPLQWLGWLVFVGLGYTIVRLFE